MRDRNQFITENHNLIYSFAHKYSLNLNEYYDLLAIALIKAADTFDDNKEISFSTYAFSVMTNEYFMEFKKRKKEALTRAISLENMITDKVPFIEVVRGESDIKNKYLYDIEILINYLDNEEKLIISYILKEYTQKQIAKILKCSQAQISRKMTSIKQKYKELTTGGINLCKK